MISIIRGEGMIKKWGIRNKSIAALMLWGILLSGCGKNAQIEEYGGQAVEVSDNTEELAENTGGGKSSELGTLADKLGGTELSCKDSIIVRGQPINVDLKYTVPDIETVPTYRVTPITAESIKEDEIVKNIFGDSAVPLNGEDRQDLRREMGDSAALISIGQSILSDNDISGYFSGERCPCWIENDNFFFHVYEGIYREKEYQMIISYSGKTGNECVLLYPKKITDMSGDEQLDNYSLTAIDGTLSTYDIETVHVIDINDIMSDRPNECSMTYQELSDVIYNTLQNDFYIKVPKDERGITFFNKEFEELYADQPEMLSKGSHNEIIYYNDSVLKDENLSGAVRNGYVATILPKYDNIYFMNASDFNPIGQMEFLDALALVDEKGIVALHFSIAYNFEEELSDNASILKFDTAMEAFKKDVVDNLDLGQLRNTTVSQKMSFEKIEMVYYPISNPDKPGESTYVPTWAVFLGTGNKGNGATYIAMVLINAVDGTYITTCTDTEAYILQIDMY